ncbi:MAG: hypothetical protein JJT89_02290 [Nitriliruptoraceae bacterium]|nr:hypothetical protein [Nitriliruptoraceae bacterium]
MRVRSAAVAACVDAVLLFVALQRGSISVGAVAWSMWLQMAVVGVGTFGALWWASFVAPRTALVDAGPPLKMTVNDSPREYVGRIAARRAAAFFTLHFGIFTVIMGLAVRDSVASGATLGALLALRTAVAVAPMLVGHVRFLSADGFAHLASKTSAVSILPYLWLFQLVGLLIVSIDGRAVSPGALVVLVASFTFLASLWRYPERGPNRPRSDGGTAEQGAARPDLDEPPPPPGAPPSTPPPTR